MKNIKKYNVFIFENAIEMIELFNDADILESIVTDKQELLNSIKAEEVDIYQTFELNPDKLTNNITIDELYDNRMFNNRLNKMNLNKSILESTEESETFIKESIVIKFFTIFNKNQSELDNPKYIIFQSKKKKDTKWEDIKCYIVKDDMKNFYVKLTNKTVEIKKDDKNYIYVTTNGNDWQLQKHNHKQNNDTFKDIMSSDEIKAILSEDGVSITIIA